jgi:cell division protein FtsI/penicillin-binding protein 2
VRLSLDLALQTRADELMKGHRGALVLLNAQSGEIFVMASHPTFDPADLNDLGMRLNKDPDKPLINRAAQGLYPLGTLVEPFAQIITGRDDKTVTCGTPDLYQTFSFNWPLCNAVAEPVSSAETQDLHVSPLQVTLLQRH